MDSLRYVARRRRNPWTSTGEVLVWILFAVLLFPVGFAGWAVGHYTSLGKPPKTVTRTVTAASSTPAPPSTSTSAATTPTTTSSGSSGGNAAAGKAVFTSVGCTSCHTFTPAGATGTIGPNLDTAPTADAKADHMPLAAFVKQSIVDPKAYLAKGYSTSVMPTYYGTQLSPTKLADLVAFIVSGQK